MLINKIAQYSVLLSTLVVLSSCDLLQVPDEKGTPEDPQNLAPKLTVVGTSGKELSAGDTVLFDLKLEDDANQMSLSWNFESSVYDYVDLDLVSNHSIMSLNNNDQLTFEFNSQQYFADKTYEVVFTVTDAKGLTHSQKMDFNVTALPLSQAISNIVIDDVKTINENSVLNINSTFDVHELINPQAVKINWTSSDEQLISSVLNSNNIEGLIPEVSQNRNVDLTYEILVLNQSVYSQIVPITIVNQNIAPTVQLQENTIVRGLEPVELIAQATDIDGLISTYLWTQTSGSPVPLDNINSDTLQFIAPDLNVEQNFEFTVTVEDNDGDTATAITSITVTPKNQLPIIEAIADQSVKANTQLTVSAIASDADGEIVSYQWTQLSGATLAVSGSETSELSITTLPVDATQNYSFELVVVDNEGGITAETFELIVIGNVLPEINLISDIDYINSDQFGILAIEATDIDGEIESIQWSQVGGVLLEIEVQADPQSVKLIAPRVAQSESAIIEVVVTDNLGGQTQKQFELEIKYLNYLTVEAGGNLQATQGDLVKLTGSTNYGSATINRAFWTSITNPAIELITLNNRFETQFIAPKVLEPTMFEFKFTATDELEKQLEVDSVWVEVIPDDSPKLFAEFIDIQQPVSRERFNLQAKITADLNITEVVWSIKYLKYYDGFNSTYTYLSVNNLDSIGDMYYAYSDIPAILNEEDLLITITVTDEESQVVSNQISSKLIPTNNRSPYILYTIKNEVMSRNIAYLSVNAGDYDGTIEQYYWEQISGLEINLPDVNTSNLNFVAPEVEEKTNFDFRVTVTDNEGATKSAIATLTVVPFNEMPIITIPNNIELLDDQIYSLNIESNDIDGEVIFVDIIQDENQEIPIRRISNSNFELTFSEIDKELSEKVYSFKVVATDNEGGVSELDFTMLVLAQNSPPKISGNILNSVYEGTDIIVSPIISDDFQNKDELTFYWEQINVDENSIIIPMDNNNQSYFLIDAFMVLENSPFDLKLTVTDLGGLSTSVIYPITIIDSPKIPEIFIDDEYLLHSNHDGVIYFEVLDEEPYLNIDWKQIILNSETELTFNYTDNNLNIEFPKDDSLQSYYFEITATDYDGLIAKKQIQVNINPAPEIEFISDKVIRENTSITVSANVNDRGGEIVRFQWSQIAGENLILSGEATSEITIESKDVDLIENYSFELLIEDNDGAIVTTTFNLSVIDLSAPIITNQSVASINEQTLFTADVLIEDDGSIQTILWEQISGPSVTLNNVDQSAVSFIAPVALANQAASVVKLQVSATDNDGVTSSLVVNVVINPVNALPTFENLSDLEITDDQIYVLNLSTLDSDGSVTDVQITQDAVQNIVITKVSNTQFEFTFDELAPQQEQMLYIFTIAATDNEGAVTSQEIEINVLAQNVAAQFNLESNTFTMKERTSFTVLLNIEDDHPIYLANLSANLISGSTGLTYAYGYSENSELAIVFTANFHEETTQYEYELTVTDADGLSTTETVYINVERENSAPEITLQDQIIVAPNDHAMTLYSVSDDRLDVQINWQQINVGDQDPVTFNSSDVMFIMLAPETDIQKTYTFELTVTDSDGLVVTQTLDVIVNPLPIVVLPYSNITIDEKSQFELTASSVTDDQEVDSVLWVQIDSHEKLVLTGADTNTLSFTAPNISESKTYEFALEATDNLGGVGVQIVTITVDPILIPPVIGLPNTTIDMDENTTITIDVNATDEEQVVDVFWNVEGMYDYIAVSGERTDQFTIEAFEHFEDTTYEFDLMVFDNDGQATQRTVVVNVNQVFVEPVIDMDVTEFTSSEYEMIQITGQASDNQGYVDYTWQQIDNNGTLMLENTDQQMVNVYSPDISVETTFTLLLTVTDVDGLTDTQEISVTFVPHYIAPSIDLNVPEFALTNLAVDFTANASDQDGEIVSILWTQTSGTPGQFTNETSDTATFVVSDVVEDLTFDVTVTDNDNQTITQSFTVTTEELVDENAPKIDLGEDKTVNEGGQVYIAAITSNTEGLSTSIVFAQVTDFDYEYHSYTNNSYQFNAFEVVNEKVIQIKASLIDVATSNIIATDYINITVLNTDNYSIDVNLDVIVDENLKQCLSAFNYTFAEQYDEINCSGLQITELTGLAQFINLQNLNVSNNLITGSLDLSTFNNLEEINVSSNDIYDIQFSANQNVKALDVSNTQVMPFSFEFIKSLGALNVKNTQMDCDYVAQQIQLNGSFLTYNSKQDCVDVLPVNTYFAQYTATAPVIDGLTDGEESLWDNSYWQPIDVFWSGVSDDNQYPSAEDLNAKYKLIWDENYLYVLVEIVDDVEITENMYWQNDNVEIFLDENNTGGSHAYAPSASNAFAFHINRLEQAIDLHSGNQFFAEENQVLTRIADQGNNKFVWEIRIALMDESFDPSKSNFARNINESEVIGFTMSVIDSDQQGRRNSFLGSVDTPGHQANQGYLDADSFGALILNPMP
ncbi:PKD domain-containing protein [Marinicellulosiphila megalodicopiae]|uniref:PKD domain-containing protein n=1 Tax=Marinicellulosiphila megalodicopiae TaxID=2724896 RepID=UPI003BB20309